MTASDGKPSDGQQGALVGQSVHRVEDARVLTGHGHYIDDLRFPGMLEAAFVRSPFPHARVLAVDVSRARELPGVVAVFTGEDIARVTTTMPPRSIPLLRVDPTVRAPEYPVLATDKVRLVGDPVALVVAESRYLAEDGCDAVNVQYEPLDAVSTAGEGLDPSGPLLFEELGSNVITEGSFEFGDPDFEFERAYRVVRQAVHGQRAAHSPIETRGAVAVYDRGSGELTFHGSTQNAHRTRLDLAAVLKFPLDRLRVVMPDVGGSFGGKGASCREDVAVCHAARVLGRPVKWIEDRRENLLTSPQAREETIEIAAAVSEDGAILALDATVTMDHGAYPVMFPSLPAMILGNMRTIIPGPYRIRGMRWSQRIVMTNKAGYTALRGPWASESLVRETLVDRIAAELGLDPAEVRRRNLVCADDQPYEMITGPTIQGINVLESLERAVERAAPFRKLRDEARAAGRRVGIGFASFIEPAPSGAAQAKAQGLAFVPERATVRIEPDGHVTVMSQQAGGGQGHETTIAQVAAQELGIPLGNVRVIFGDTATVPFGMIGTGASRGAFMATGAVTLAVRELRRKVLGLAAVMLDVAQGDLDIVDGMLVGPERSVPLAQLAPMAWLAAPPGEEPGLRSTGVFALDRGAFAGGTHVCVVEVDGETGTVEVLAYLVVERCGKIVNPAVADGQIRGGIAHGIGLALLEHLEYADGNFPAGTFMDYLLPSAAEIPRISIEHLEGELIDEFDFRGVAEGGTVAAPPAVLNAVADALGGAPDDGWSLPATPVHVLALAQARGAAAASGG